ncbi:MAG: glycosyltransferase family 4 protein [Marinobacterium sp.]|nr:glycosyltransferase family 4 protein [Marinobacterium sp.]
MSSHPATSSSPASPSLQRSIILLLDSRQGGGIESHILQLAIALQQRGYPVVVLFMVDYGPHPLQGSLDAAGIQWQIAPGRYPALARWLCRYALLVNTHGYKAGIVGRLLARLMRVPVVSTWHAGEQGHGRLRVYQWLDRLTAPLAPALAVSQPIADRLPVPAQVIRNFTALPAPPTRQQPTSLQVGFVGRLSHEKGPDLFCQLATALPAGRAEMFGDGPLYSLLHARYRHHIRFHGYCQQMEPHWPRLGVLCVSSRAEGLPMVALEAMARGIPVIAFAVGALPQLISHGHNGFLVPAGDIAVFRHTLQRWTQLPVRVRRQLSQNAYQTIHQHYSPDAALPDILQCWQRAGLAVSVAKPADTAR